MVTMVEGIEDSAIDIGKLAKLLKSACASGGTVKAAPSNSKVSTRSVSPRSLNRMDIKWRCDK